MVIKAKKELPPKVVPEDSNLTHLCLMHRGGERAQRVTPKQQALLSTLVIALVLSLSLSLTLILYRQPVPRSSGLNTTADLPPSVVLPNATAFAYKISHTPLLLPDNFLKATPASGELKRSENRASPADLEHVRAREFSRLELCSFAAAVARSNNLPIPFFANLIWQESSFRTKVISRAGAQGIAQFMPRTAVEFGLLNPFDPLHALAASGNLLRQLYRSFGNLGLAAAAYNAGPQRVKDWINKGPLLPEETRSYVLRITSRPVEDWLQLNVRPEDILLPPRAPCREVTDALQAQWVMMRITEEEFAQLPSQADDTVAILQLRRIENTQ
jgi:hypothetical protein